MPQAIVARIRADDGKHVSARLLITLEMFWRGQPYYGDLLGITDAAGLATITGEELSAHFARDQRLFPMDYKVSLDECDTRLRVGMRGGSEFKDALGRLAANAMVDPEVRTAYLEAQNQQFDSSWVDLDLSTTDDPVIADIVTRRVR